MVKQKNKDEEINMNTQTLNLVIAFVATVILGIIVVPKLRKKKVGQIVRTDGPKEHLKKQGTPTMGGIIMIIVLVLILGFNVVSHKILILPIVSILGFGIVGFIDDYKKLIKKEILEEINKTDKNINGVQIYADDMQKALFKQLEIKDKQIEQLTNRISELNALMLNNQLMLNNLQEQIKQLNAPKEPPQEPESKRNIWTIFKRKH